MITRKQALHALASHPDLALMYELDTYRTEFLVDLAFECPLFQESKQASLNALMLYAKHIVGSIAACSELRNKKYEIALYAFLDWLLPEMVAVEEVIA